jgi:hypothetical protein
MIQTKTNKKMRKTVTVSVQIQMDIKTKNDILPQVQDVLELMNEVVSDCRIDASPQIFISDISDSDIIENEDEEIKMCQKYQDSEALSDEDGNCSLCGGNCVE